jgi:cytochrome c oxidase subunit 1
MSTATIDTHPPDGGGHDGHAHESYLVSHGNLLQRIWSWMYTLDHKRIGMLYLVSIMIAFGLGGLMATLIRLELFERGPGIMQWIVETFNMHEPAVPGSTAPPLPKDPANLYNQVMTLHGVIMVFLFIIPSIPAALGNFFLPLQIGAKDVAFPRLNLASYWVYVLGACFAVFSMLNSAADTGWTLYTPYSTDAANQNAIVSMTLGAFIIGFSSIFTGLNFIVTVHKLRAPGMTWFSMPLFVWALYATSVIQVLATPVLGITLLLLVFERYVGVGIFDPLMGGDPVLYQHFFWFYSHPAVYIMILPGMGIISELISCYSRKPVFGYRFVAFSSIAIALIGFIVWGHHMFTSGQSEIAVMIFSALTFLVSIPSAIKVFNWLATMYRGSIELTTGMLYALSFIFLFSIGGLTGLFLGTLAIDIHLHDTYFVVAHFHYVMMGGTVMAFLGGLHHWWPKMTGKMYPDWLGRIACFLVFVGFNLTFFTQFIMGSHGMPRRYFDYPDVPIFDAMHKASTAGAMVLGVGFLLTLSYLLWSLFKGPAAPANPWGGATLEWETASPPILHNFEHMPDCHDRPAYDYGVDPEQATVKR